MAVVPFKGNQEISVLNLRVYHYGSCSDEVALRRDIVSDTLSSNVVAVFK
jgi:hypothetical protein